MLGDVRRLWSLPLGLCGRVRLGRRWLFGRSAQALALVTPSSHKVKLMSEHSVRRGLLLLAIMAIGVVAIGAGVKYDNRYLFVPGVIAAVGGFVIFTGSSRR